MRAGFALAIVQHVQARLHAGADLVDLLLQRFHHGDAVFVGVLRELVGLGLRLVENAARVSPEGAPIELSARAAGEGTVELEVADRGPGLPHALAARFDPLAPRGGAAELGSGLGLAIADSFARVSFGALALEPRPGGGTIARVRLPAAP